MKYKQLNQKTITFAMSPYSVLQEDDILNIDTSGGAITINLESITGVKRDLWINDINGTNPITISPAGLDTINGSASYAFQSADNTLYISSLSSGLWSVLTTDTPTPSSATTINNTLHVMKNGNNGTALPDRLDLPYLTVNAAISAANSGDTVMIWPGTYLRSIEGQITLKDGVTIQCIDGTIFDQDVDNTDFFTDGGVSITTRLNNLTTNVSVSTVITTQMFSFTGATTFVYMNKILSNRTVTNTAVSRWLFTNNGATIYGTQIRAVNQSNIVNQNGTSFIYLQGEISQIAGNNANFYVKNNGTLRFYGRLLANGGSTATIALNYSGAGGSNGEDYIEGEFGTLNLAASSLSSVAADSKVTVVGKIFGRVSSGICTYVRTIGDIESTSTLGAYSVGNTTGRSTHKGDIFASVLGINTSGNNGLIDLIGNIYNSGVAATSHGISGSAASRVTHISGKCVLSSATAFYHNGSVANSPIRIGLVMTNRPASANSLIQVNGAGLIFDATNVT